jgi:hypothetical protein
MLDNTICHAKGLVLRRAFTYISLICGEALHRTLLTAFHDAFNGLFNDKGHAGLGARGSVVVKALCYKPEGRGLGTR